MKYNPEIHHRRSIRLKHFDYTRDLAYFVTICTRDKGDVFGKIEGGRVYLNSVGKMFCGSWLMIESLGWPPFEGRLWHKNYYDRIIRDKKELEDTRRYILDNPVKWEIDEYNKKNVHQGVNNDRFAGGKPGAGC